MFRDFISKPIDPVSQEYVNTISRIEGEPDYSLTCLGLAMLKHRVENYSGIKGVDTSFTNIQNCLEDFYERVQSIDEYPLFCYYRYNHEDYDKEYLEGNLKEFKQKASITTFVKDKTSSDCIVLYHEEKNAVAIIVNSSDIRLYHLLLSFISLYYPSLFKDNPLKEEDFAIIKSLSKKDKNEFCACIKKVLEKYTIEFRQVSLVGFMKKLHETKIVAAKNDVDNQRMRVQDFEQKYSEAIQLLKGYIVTYEGMKATESYDDSEKELVDYLTQNKCIHNIDFHDNRLYFTVSTLLNNYSVEAWEVFSSRGHIYDGEYSTRLPEVFENRDNRKLILDNIFSDDPKLMVKMAGNYSLDFNSCRVGCDSGYNYNEASYVFENCLPNPHIKLFACLGGYKDRIMNVMRNRNYISAVEMCLASAGSVNLDETTQTFRPFLGWIMSSNKKILRAKDGTEMTPVEALEWLKEKSK